MTGTDVITYRVRPILADTTTTPTTQIWYDEDLMYFLMDGIQLLIAAVPESMLYDPNGMYTFVETTSLTAELYVPNRFREALVDYVAARAFDMDGQDKRDLARAAKHADGFSRKSGVGLVNGMSGRRG